MHSTQISTETTGQTLNVHRDEHTEAPLPSRSTHHLSWNKTRDHLTTDWRVTGGTAGGSTAGTRPDVTVDKPPETDTSVVPVSCTGGPTPDPLRPRPRPVQSTAAAPTTPAWARTRRPLTVKSTRPARRRRSRSPPARPAQRLVHHDVTVGTTGATTISGPSPAPRTSTRPPRPPVRVQRLLHQRRRTRARTPPPLTVKLDKTGPTAALASRPERWATTAGTPPTSPSTRPALRPSAARSPAPPTKTRRPRPPGSVQRLLHQQRRPDHERDRADGQARQDRPGRGARRHGRNSGDNGWYTYRRHCLHTRGSDGISGPVSCTADQSLTERDSRARRSTASAPTMPACTSKPLR